MTEVFDEGPFFHGTKAHLEVGDLLTAGFNSNYRPEVVMNHIYFTALVDGAGLTAEVAAVDSSPHVYEVEPTGDYENDPNVTDKKLPGNPTRSYRSTAPLRILREVTYWKRLTAVLARAPGRTAPREQCRDHQLTNPVVTPAPRRPKPHWERPPAIAEVAIKRLPRSEYSNPADLGTTLTQALADLMAAIAVGTAGATALAGVLAHFADWRIVIGLALVEGGGHSRPPTSSRDSRGTVRREPVRDHRPRGTRPHGHHRHQPPHLCRPAEKLRSEPTARRTPCTPV